MAKFVCSDKELFLQILANYPIVEDKKTDTYHIEKKRKAWEKITVEFNAAAKEKRTTVQLKRLWDKMKRSRKSQQAEERRELMATGGGPPRPSPSPQPMVDNLIPYSHYEIDVTDDSDGIQLGKVQVLLETPEEPVPSTSDCKHVPDPAISKEQLIVMEVQAPQSSSIGPASSQSEAITSTSKECMMEAKTPKSSGKMIELGSSKKRGPVQTKQLEQLTAARLGLIEKENQQMEELHKIRMEEHQIRMEEAQFRREAARLQMLQEELKLQRIRKKL